jgi:L-alanine-DL-glutamate epimerase-like enolase superfamily enzyme
MKIVSVETRVEAIPLSRPYTIAFRSVSDVENMIVVVRTDDGRTGLGAASPEHHVTGETADACKAALAPGALDWLIGLDVRTLPALARRLDADKPHTPAARAAVDMALYDLLAQGQGLPLCEMLGRAHTALPTSITIGIKSAEEALREADEYLGRGFRILKVKTGLSLEEDIDRLRRIRVHVDEKGGPRITIRADANQGYSAAETRRYFAETKDLDIEFVEQPVKKHLIDELRALPEADRERIAADESVQVPVDALRVVTPPRPAGIFNIKLMKCGGVWSAQRIATVAELAGVRLMWGCMDESCISIAAALHVALASPATRYLDLDGSFDLARDVAEGGFVVEGGIMRPLDAPGLGVRLVS